MLLEASSDFAVEGVGLAGANFFLWVGSAKLFSEDGLLAVMGAGIIFFKSGLISESFSPWEKFPKMGDPEHCL